MWNDSALAGRIGCGGTPGSAISPLNDNLWRWSQTPAVIVENLQCPPQKPLPKHSRQPQAAPARRRLGQQRLLGAADALEGARGRCRRRAAGAYRSRQQDLGIYQEAQFAESREQARDHRGRQAEAGFRQAEGHDVRNEQISVRSPQVISALSFPRKRESSHSSGCSPSRAAGKRLRQTLSCFETRAGPSARHKAWFFRPGLQAFVATMNRRGKRRSDFPSAWRG